MSELAVSVFAASAALGALGLIAYRLGDAVQRFAFAVLLSLAVVSSLSEAIADLHLILDGTSGGGGQDNGLYAEVGEIAFSAGIAESVADKFSLDRSEIAVRLVGFDFSQMRAEKIIITLSGSAAPADMRGIEKYISDEKLGECEVKIEFR